MVLSDGLVYRLKIETIFCRIHQNYLMALNRLTLNTRVTVNIIFFP